MKARQSAAELADRDPVQPWATAAGFANIFEAENAGCRKGNAHLYRNGKRLSERDRLTAKAQAKLDAQEAGGRAKAPARGYDAADLLSMPMAEPNYIVRPFVPEGVTLWCGRPKAGKTTALRQLAHAANTGGTFLGEPCTSVEVWFLSLEEGERLFRKKLSMMQLPIEDLRGIRLEFEWPQGAEGVKALHDRLRERVDARPVLIIIDSLQRFRLPQSDRGHAFTEDYNAAKLLAELCKEFPGLAIVVLHHTTKAVPDDPVAAISGTYGLTAAADSYAIMMKQGLQYRLHAGGRLWDRDASDYELKRSDGGWQMVGEWEATTAPKGLAPKQEQVLEALKSGAKSNRTLAEMTGQSASALSHMLGKLEDRGLVVRIANGWGLVS
jgi:RecA-family ATPase